MIIRIVCTCESDILKDFKVSLQISESMMDYIKSLLINAYDEFKKESVNKI
jgi:hypothetical protein